MNRHTGLTHEVLANGPGMPVVIYLRKSNKTKRQSREETVSVQQQRKEVMEWCARNRWVVIREYIDDGKSASRNEHKRESFHRMLAEIKALGDFRTVVVWDLSRLTRKDSVDAATAAAVLKTHGILVESLRDGEIDLNQQMGRHMWNLHCEQNHDFAIKISGGTIRGRKDAIDLGKWPHGRIPYGYDRAYYDGENHIMTLHRNAPASKARTWATKLIANATESVIATRIFHDFAYRDVSIRGLAIELTREGIIGPTGGRWKPAHIKQILTCPVYLGQMAIGYSTRRNYEAHAHSEPHSKADTCPALTDPKTWKIANNKLTEQAESGRRVHTGKASPLSGIVFCGHCGCRMVKSFKKGRVRFTCSSAAKNSAHPTCHQWTVRESELMEKMNDVLANAVDFAILRDLQADPPASDAGQLEELKRQQAELERKVKTAGRNLALTDAENLADVQAVLNEYKTELDKVKNTIHLIQSAGDKTELQRIAAWWKDVRPTLVEVTPARELRFPAVAQPDGSFVGKAPANMVEMALGIRAQPDVYRDLLKRLNCKLTLHFAPKGKRYFGVDWGRFEATIDEHSIDASRPAAAPARTARPCASKFRAPPAAGQALQRRNHQRRHGQPPAQAALRFVRFVSSFNETGDGRAGPQRSCV